MHRMERLEGRTLFASYAAANVTELIAAIRAANASTAADTIALAAGATFTLTAMDNTTGDGATGLPVIVANSGGLTVIGNSATIERSGATGMPEFRLFSIAEKGSLTLLDLTLQGGVIRGSQAYESAAGVLGSLATPGQGGAIFNRGTLTLDRVVIQNNAAYGAAGYAGWVVANPSPAEGGGIFSSGQLNITNSTIRQNVSLGGRGVPAQSNYYFTRLPGPGADGSGGGIFVAGGSAVVGNSTFTANTAQGGFGGAFLQGSTATGGNGYGGGIHASGGNLAVRNSVVNANAALGGEGRLFQGNKLVLAREGIGTGGGIYIGNASAGLDAFTVKNTKANTATTSARDIFGSYSKLV
jgi:hypothetical protein